MTAGRRSSRRLALVGGGAFVATLLVAAPASLLAPAIDGAPGVSYSAIEGRIWRGRVAGLRHGGTALGDVDFRIRPAGLLTGSLVIAFDVDGGALAGDGELSVGALGRLDIRRAALTFDLSSIRRYTLFGLPYSGELRLDIDRFAATQKGCVEAAVMVRTSILDAAAVQHVGEGLVLAGPVTCDGENLVAALTGENGMGALRVDARVLPNLSYQLEASVTPTGSDAVADLRRLGFETENGAFTFGAAGALQGLGS